MGSHASCSWQQLLELAKWQAVCAGLLYIPLLICRAKSLVTCAVKAVIMKGSRTHYTIGYAVVDNAYSRLAQPSQGSASHVAEPWQFMTTVLTWLCHVTG